VKNEENMKYLNKLLCTAINSHNSVAIGLNGHMFLYALLICKVQQSISTSNKSFNNHIMVIERFVRSTDRLLDLTYK